MMGVLRFTRRLIAWLNRRRLDDELREEIEQHIQLRREQLIRDGVELGEADAAARRAFGSTVNVREQARSIRSFPVIDGLARDVRYGTRLLWRAPLFTCSAVLSLAIGIGSTAAVFSVADAVLFRPLAVANPQQLHELRATLFFPGSTKVLGGVSEATLSDMQRHTDFAELAGFRIADDLVVASGGVQRPVTGEFISANYFATVGVYGHLGGLLANDITQTPLPVVVSDRLSETMFDDTAVEGRAITVNGVPATIVGVTRAFRGLVAERPADLFVPLAATALLDPAVASTGVRLVVRLSPTVPRGEGEQRFAALYKQLSPSSFPADALRISLPDAGRGISDARELLAAPVSLGLAITFVLLLVACANTGGLLVTRFASRRGEFGIRMAIGAGRGRVAWQLLVEALMLATIAAGVGLLVADAVGPLLIRSIPLGSAPVAFDVRFDWRLITFTIGISSAAGVVAAAASVTRLFRGDTANVLNSSARTLVRGRLRATHVLIAGQVACSLFLLVAAGSLTRTLMNLADVDPGFDPADAVAVSVDASGLGMSQGALPPYFSSLHERLQSLPEVARVSFAQLGLMTGARTTGTVDIPGWVAASDEQRLTRLFWVGPDFFETAGMRLILGRTIGRRESIGRERVAVVNQEFARFYFGTIEAALGAAVNGDVRIIGIVADARFNTLRDSPVRAMFLPHTQAPPRASMTFFVRPSGDSTETVGAVTAAVRRFESRLKLKAVPVADLVSATMSRERFVATLVAIVSVLAMFLTCAGLYGAVAYAVSERRREVAVRIALGAPRREVVRLVLRDPLRATLLGLVLGIPGVYVIMRGLSSLLFGVEPFDVTTTMACGAILLTVAAVAALGPARRAATIDPLECLNES